MKVYISGRIKDYPDHLQHFARAEKLWSGDKDVEVINPCTLPHKPDATYEDFMRTDLNYLLQCDAIYMLQGWERSVGARCEHMVAAMCGLLITYEDHA